MDKSTYYFQFLVIEEATYISFGVADYCWIRTHNLYTYPNLIVHPNVGWPVFTGLTSAIGWTSVGNLWTPDRVIHNAPRFHKGDTLGMFINKKDEVPFPSTFVVTCLADMTTPTYQTLVFYLNGGKVEEFELVNLREKNLHVVSTVGPGGVVALRYSGTQVISTCLYPATFLSRVQDTVPPPRKEAQILMEAVVVWNAWATTAQEDTLVVKEGDVIEVYSMPDDEEYWYGRNKRTGEVGRFASVTVDKAN